MLVIEIVISKNLIARINPNVNSWIDNLKELPPKNNRFLYYLNFGFQSEFVLILYVAVL